MHALEKIEKQWLKETDAERRYKNTEVMKKKKKKRNKKKIQGTLNGKWTRLLGGKSRGLSAKMREELKVKEKTKK